MVEKRLSALAIDERRTPFEPTLWMHKPKPGQTIEQVWFCGVHSDVGGGYPGARGSSYDSINPIRAYRNTTYYAVWSIAYLPCNTSSTDRRKIFVTVYWIDPEPSDSGIADVQTKIAAGTYTIKSVSLIVDKAIGTES